MKKIPQEIIESFAIEWDNHLIRQNGYLSAKTQRFHIEIVQKHLSSGIYNALFEDTDIKFGATIEERSSFWKTVFSGNYDKFFEKFPKTQKVQVNNEIFMI